ncbi:MAG: GNAT family N-acetyltransferase [Ilumatobacter sp.]|nr:GNAT family N-acetyltransferase [Ilumatobacter sp.]
MREEAFDGGAFLVRCGEREHDFRANGVRVFTPQRRHLGAINACLIDREAQSFLGYGDDRMTSLVSSEPWWRRFDRRPTQYHQNGIIFGIEADQHEGVVGGIFIQIDSENVPNIGVAVRQECRSSGVGTAAIGLAVHFLVHHFGQPRLTATTLSTNVRAIGLARSVGGQIVEVDVPRVLDDGRAVSELRHELHSEAAVRRCDHSNLLAV